MITVKDLAEATNTPIKELVRELTNQAPDINWKASTPVPEKFAESYKEGAKEYKEASEPVGALVSSEGEGASIEQMRINLEATQYAIVEALGQVDMKDIITAAISHSVTEIETYEATKAQVWDGYIQARLQSSSIRQNEAKKRFEEQAVQRQQGISSRMTKQQHTSNSAKQALDEIEVFKNQILGAM